MTNRRRSRSGSSKQSPLDQIRQNFAAVNLDRRWLVAAPAAFVLAGLGGFNSFVHVSKSAGACPVLHPAFCATQALQAPVIADFGRDNVLNDKDQALRLARAAINLVPLNPAAVRNIALASGGSTDRSNAQPIRLLRLSHKLSRRDGVTESLLIDDAAKRADMAAALEHFDALLRSMPVASARYMEHMGLALADPKFRKGMIPYANRDNPWFGRLGGAILSNTPPIRFYGQFLSEVPSLPDTVQQRLHYDQVVSRLAQEGEYAIVRKLYPRLPGADRTEVTSMALPSAKQTPYRPVTWWLQSDGAIGAELSRTGKAEMVAYAEAGTSGTVASKLLFLAPGQYRLGWKATNDNGEESPSDGDRDARRDKSRDGLSWSIDCPGLQRREIGAAPAERPGSQNREIAVTFTVPAGCTVQNVALQTRVDSSGSSSQWTVSDISVRPVAAAKP